MNGSSPARAQRAQWLRKRFRALRAFSFPVSVLPVLVAAAAVRPPGQWRWGVLIASALATALLHAAGNLLNDYFDFRSGVDRKVQDDEGRPGRLLVCGELRPDDVAAEAAACLLLAAPLGAYLIWQCGPGLLWFALAGLLALYAYTGPPMRMKYRALGELVVFVAFGPALMLGAAYAQTGRLEGVVLLLSIPVGLATVAILVGNNLRDLQEDDSAGIRTLAHVAGVRLTRGLYMLLLVGCVLSLAAMAAARVVPRVVMLAPATLFLLREPLLRVWRNERLPDIDARTARFESALLVLVFLALAFGGGASAVSKEAVPLSSSASNSSSAAAIRPIASTSR